MNIEGILFLMTQLLIKTEDISGSNLVNASVKIELFKKNFDVPLLAPLANSDDVILSTSFTGTTDSDGEVTAELTPTQNIQQASWYKVTISSTPHNKVSRYFQMPSENANLRDLLEAENIDPVPGGGGGGGGGGATGILLWVSGDTYQTDQAVVENNLPNAIIYRCIHASSFVSSTRPSLDPTNWQETGKVPDPRIELSTYTYIDGITATLSAGQFRKRSSGDTEWLVKLKSNESFLIKAGDTFRLERQSDQWLEGTISNTSTLSDNDGAELTINLTSVQKGAGFDAATKDGTWKVIRVEEDEGLVQVYANRPFRGKGTGSDPLDIDEATESVKGAMSAADKTKLDGIANDTHQNPKHIFNVRAVDGDTSVTINPGVIGLIKSDNTQFQNGSMSDIAAIEIQFTMFGVTQDPQIDTANDTSHQSLLNDLSSNGGYLLLELQIVGQSHISYVRARSVSKQSDHYALSNLDWVNPETISGTGKSWSVGGMNTNEMLFQDLKGLGNATTANSGLMSSTDKGKLDTIVAEDALQLGTYTYSADQNPNDIVVGQYEITNVNAPQRRITVRPHAANASDFAARWHNGFTFKIGSGVTIRLIDYNGIVPHYYSDVQAYRGHFQIVSGSLPSTGTASAWYVEGELVHSSDLATVAKTGNYADLHGRPTIPMDTDYYEGAWSSSVTYKAAQMVSKGGFFWLSKQDNNTNHDPETDTSETWWDKIGVGSPDDVISVTKSGDIVTVTDRDNSTTTFSLAEYTNPRFVSLPFRTEDGSNADDAGLTFFIKSDNTQWQSGSSNQIAAVEIHRQQYDLTQNPQVADAEYTAWHSFLDDIIQSGGSTIWTFQRIDDNNPNNALSGQLFRLQSETIIKNSDGNYVLQNIVSLVDYSTNGTGYNWQVVGVFAPSSGSEDIVGQIDWSKLANIPARVGTFTTADEKKLDGLTNFNPEPTTLGTWNFGTSAETSGNAYVRNTYITFGKVNAEGVDKETELEGLKTGSFLLIGNDITLRVTGTAPAGGLTARVDYVVTRGSNLATAGSQEVKVIEPFVHPENLDITGDTPQNLYAPVYDSATDKFKWVRAIQFGDIAEKETDKYASYTNAFFGSGYRTGSFCFYTQDTVPTNDDNAVRQPDIADRNTNGVIALGATLRSDRNPNNFVAAQTDTAASYSSGRCLLCLHLE